MTQLNRELNDPVRGVLLINVGSPESPTAGHIRRYLRSFLCDGRVIDLPCWLRIILVNCFIIPSRLRAVIHAYRSIWKDPAGPLVTETQALAQNLAVELGQGFRVAVGMRYEQPSIQSGVQNLLQQGVEQITVLPLYPQYASATTGSAVVALFKALETEWNLPSFKVITDFFAHPAFIKAYVAHIKSSLTGIDYDHLLFSYHGLPERHIQKSQCRYAVCRDQACPAVTPANRYCYRAQCFTTAGLLASQLKLEAAGYSVSFQSRVGRLPWIQPDTEPYLAILYQQGVRDLVVLCPSFVTDCLETLEEINIRARALWLKLGGRSFHYLPCLNSSPAWIQALVELID